MIDHVGLAARLARIPVSTLMRVYAHINPSVKRVLDTSIMTRKLIDSGFRATSAPTLSLSFAVMSKVAVIFALTAAPRSSIETLYHPYSDPNVSFLNLQPESAGRNRSGSCENPEILGPGLC